MSPNQINPSVHVQLKLDFETSVGDSTLSKQKSGG